MDIDDDGGGGNDDDDDYYDHDDVICGCGQQMLMVTAVDGNSMLVSLQGTVLNCY